VDILRPDIGNMMTRLVKPATDKAVPLPLRRNPGWTTGWANR
jgi:hypothetical protein